MNPFEAKYTAEALELIAEMEKLLLLLETYSDDASPVQPTILKKLSHQ